MNNINKKLFVLICVSALMVFGAVQADDKTYTFSTAAYTTGGGSDGPVIAGPNYETGFEPGEGFAPGYCGGQQGWTAFLVSSTEGHIDTANPASGVQELRISNDPAAGIFVNTGCFSPDMGVQDVDLTTVSVDISISETGGADYDVAPQAPSQGFLTTEVKFDWLGNIQVIDGGGFVDTGVDWPVDTYFNLLIVIDPANDSIDYYIDDALIYSGAMVAATTVEQVVLLSDNFQVDDSADFDNLVIQNDPIVDYDDARFRVSKVFTDGNPSEVEVTLSCFTGLPLIQSQMISGVQDVNFIVESFTEGELDCNVTEEELLGYSANYFNGTVDSSDSCEYVDLVNGQYECAITNSPDPVTIEIDKEWIIENQGGDAVDQNFRVTLFCSAEIVGGEFIGDTKGSGPGFACGFFGSELGNALGSKGSLVILDWCKTMDGHGDTTFSPQVIPEYPGSVCIALETVYDSGVEVQNGCIPLEVEAGMGDSCTITNTVFFEGIPTLSQYGMAILALLMLVLGFVGFRRFV